MSNPLEKWVAGPSKIHQINVFMQSFLSFRPCQSPFDGIEPSSRITFQQPGQPPQSQQEAVHLNNLQKVQRQEQQQEALASTYPQFLLP
jgi:hypothetical protein